MPPDRSPTCVFVFSLIGVLSSPGCPSKARAPWKDILFNTTAEADFTLARFNPANLQHPILTQLGNLDGDFQLSLQGSFDAGERIARITSGLEMESAEFQPGEALSPFLADAVPIHRFSVRGHLFLDSDFASSAEFSISTGLGNFDALVTPESFSITPYFP